jgi:hypothetical protein
MAATVRRLGRATEAVQDSVGEDPRERLTRALGRAMNFTTYRTPVCRAGGLCLPVCLASRADAAWRSESETMA